MNTEVNALINLTRTHPRVMVREHCDSVLWEVGVLVSYCPISETPDVTFDVSLDPTGRVVTVAQDRIRFLTNDVKERAMYELTINEYEDVESLGEFDTFDEALMALGRYVLDHPDGPGFLYPHITRVS